MKLVIWTSSKSESVKNIVAPYLAQVGLTSDVIVNHDTSKIPFGEDTAILAMGKEAYEVIKSAQYVPKNRTLDSMRGQLINGRILVSYSPDAVWMDASKAPQIKWDVRLMERFMRTGQLKPVLGDYRYVEDFSELIASVKAKFAETGKPVPVALDLETMGLYPYYSDKHIITVQMSIEHGKSDVAYVLGAPTTQVNTIKAQIQALLSSRMVVTRGANLKFDLVWLAEKYAIDCTNFTFDTLLVGSLLDENRSNSLKLHAKLFTDLGGYDDDMHKNCDMGELEKADKKVLLQYAGADTDATLQVSDKFISDLRTQPKLLRFYTQLLHPASRTFEKIERRGVVIDREKFAALRVELVQELERLEKEAFSIIPATIRAKYADNLSLSRAVILKDFFFTSPSGLKLKPKMTSEKTKEPSTAIEHLLMFEDEGEEVTKFVELLKEWNTAKKTLSTYVDGFLVHARPDGRFHPTYMLFQGDMYGDDDKSGGTVTGRLSAKDPAMQTLPKHTKWAKKLRACYIAPPGYKVFEMDFSQGELRIIAWLSGDKNMLQAYLEGKDLHALTGSGLAGIPYDTFMTWAECGDKELEAKFKYFRKSAKPANFGLTYGIQPEGYRDYARKNYGVKMSKQEAEAQHAAFFQTYPQLPVWHENYKNFAHQNGYIESPLGRIRHLPLINSRNFAERSKAERQAINSPVQGALSDFCIWAATLLENKFAPEGLWIAGLTHDAIYGYVPEEKAKSLIEQCVNVMGNLPFKEVFNITPPLQFPADAEIGDTLATLEKVHF